MQINRYDAEGLRHEMEEDGKLVQFIFRGDEVVTEETENKVIRFIRGYDLVASDAESARTYYHYASDEMSSITHVVTGEDKECREEAQQNPRTASSDKTDAVVLNCYEYDAWGNTTVCEETVENRFKFNGQQLDPVTQQYYLRARFYNPVIARFTQEDTYRGDGLNLYAYCKNNPVYYVDPSGHWCDRKEKVYKDLLKERGITEADLANDPDLKLRLMAEASNIVKSQKKNNTSGNNSSENKPDAPEALNPNAESRDKSGSSSELKVVGTYNNNNYFTRAVEFNAGSNGTGFTYKVYQRNDIDWNMVRTTGAKKGRGLTNAQAAEKYGLAPILNDGYVATLHHSQQRSIGSLFEASTRYHNISNAKKGPLHPYKGQLNPYSPMDSTTRGLFQKVDSIEYWKARGRDAMKGVQ